MSTKSWYTITNKENKPLEISIHDEIGLWGISAKDFLNDLAQYPNATHGKLSIHTPGGSMIDGFAMYNGIKSHPAKFHGHVEGIAASMGSVVLMACDTISMPENAFLMIHNPSGGAYGGSEDLRQIADLMDKFKNSALSIYQERTGLDVNELSDMLDAETWLDGNEALSMGFIDTVTDSVDVAAKTTSFDKHFKNMPIDSKKNSIEDINSINSIKDFERFLRESGGVSRRVATALSNRAKVVFQSDSEPPADTSISELLNVVSRFKVPESL